MNKKYYSVFINLFLIFWLFFAYIVSYELDNIVFVLLFTMLVWGRNMIVGMKNILFLAFNSFIFLFLLSRPSIGYINNIFSVDIDRMSAFLSLFIIGVSLIGLNLGFNIIIYKKIDRAIILDRFPSKLLFIVFIFFIILKYVLEIKKYTLYKELSYTDLYLLDNYEYGILDILSSFSIYFFISFLSCMPRMKLVYIAFVIYIGSIIPSLILGERAEFAVSVVFSYLYITIRRNLEINSKAISRKNKLLLVTSIISLIFLFSKVQDFREGDHSNYNELNSISNFLYLQGTSFDTVSQGVFFEEEIKSENEKYISYTMGPVIDQLMHNKLSQILFNQIPLVSGNDIINVRESNNLAHPLSYIVLDGSYLNGHGRGSSFVLENYLDLGVGGVLLFSIILGVTIHLLWNSIATNSFIYRNILFFMIMNLALLPRGNYSHFLVFLFDMKFWLCLLVSIFLIKIRLKEKR